MFGDHWLSQIPEQRHEEFFIQVEDLSGRICFRTNDGTPIIAD